MVHVDIERAYQAALDLPDIIRSETGRALVEHCMETPRRATVRGFRKLVQKVIIMTNSGKLPANAAIIQNQVAALALARRTPKVYGLCQTSILST